jgi:hypothetical protein
MSPVWKVGAFRVRKLATRAMVVPEVRADGKRRDRLGPGFAKLWLAQGVSNLGDGVYLTAGSGSG